MNTRYGMVIDQERCIGCEACTVACKIENKAGEYWIRVQTEGSEVKDAPSGRFPELRLCFLPKMCNHCADPPCVDACPAEAIAKREDGIVVLDQETCDGCQVCLDACPYQAIAFNEDSGKAEKCNLCHHRLDQGQEPFCQKCCEGRAMHFGDLNDPNSTVAQLAGRDGAFVLKPEAGTHPAVSYLPPKPPRGL